MSAEIIHCCLQSLGVNMHVKNEQVCQCHVIVIAVKPYLVAKVLEEIKQHLQSHHVIVSLAAGVKLADMSAVSAAPILLLCIVGPLPYVANLANGSQFAKI